MLEAGEVQGQQDLHWSVDWAYPRYVPTAQEGGVGQAAHAPAESVNPFMHTQLQLVDPSMGLALAGISGQLVQALLVLVYPVLQTMSHGYGLLNGSTLGFTQLSTLSTCSAGQSTHCGKDVGPHVAMLRYWELRHSAALNWHGTHAEAS